MDELFAPESLPTAPMLDIDGDNWPVFKNKFEDHLGSLGLDAHFDAQNYPPKSYEEIEAKPIKKDTESNDDFEKRLVEWKEGEEKWTERQKAWKRDDAMARLALGGVVPDSLYLEISKHRRFCEMWKAVEARMELTAPYHKSNLKYRLNRMYCTEQDNILAHLEDMENIYQQLASRNARVSDEDYVSAIIRSLPESYSKPMSSLLMIYRLRKLPTTPETLKDAIRNEYEVRQMARNKRSNGVALQADGMGRAPGRGRGRGNHRGGDRAGGHRDQSGLTCFNCGVKGHKAAVCSSPRRPRGRNRPGQQ